MEDNAIEIVKDELYAEVSEWQGKKRLDIRRWYVDNKNGELKRTRKGITLSPTEWNQFAGKLDDLKELAKGLE